MNKSIIIASVQMHITKSKTENLKTMENYLDHINKLFPNLCTHSSTG